MFGISQTLTHGISNQSRIFSISARVHAFEATKEQWKEGEAMKIVLRHPRSDVDEIAILSRS
jgi:hypothetical protein